MIEVEMSDDIRKYETKTLGPFTTKQLVCIVISLIYSIPIALLTPVSIINKFLIGAALAIPCILCGYIKVNGTPLEVMIFRFAYLSFLTPSKRKFIVQNPYRKHIENMKKAEEKEAFDKLTKKEKKKVLKEQKKNANVTYSKQEQYKIYR